VYKYIALLFPQKPRQKKGQHNFWHVFHILTYICLTLSSFSFVMRVLLTFSYLCGNAGQRLLRKSKGKRLVILPAVSNETILLLLLPL
jgi:hypothetical protein